MGACGSGNFGSSCNSTLVAGSASATGIDFDLDRLFEYDRSRGGGLHSGLIGEHSAALERALERDLDRDDEDVDEDSDELFRLSTGGRRTDATDEVELDDDDDDDDTRR